MAWCPHCKEDRPIARQTYKGACRHCLSKDEHKDWCRGPVKGALDACQFCNEPIFAKAKNEVGYEKLEAAETQGRDFRSTRPLLGSTSKKVLSVFVAGAALNALIDIRKTDLTPMGIAAIFLLALAIWPWPKKQGHSSPKKQSGCVGKGCLGVCLFFLFLMIAPHLVKTHSLTMKISPGANALVEVEGPVSRQERGPDVVLQRLPQGSYTFKVTTKGYKIYKGAFEVPKNKNLAISLSPDVGSSSKQQAPQKQQSSKKDPAYPLKLVSILSKPTEFNGVQCALQVEGDGWHKSEWDGRWNAVLRKSFGENEVSCLLESENSSTVQRVELEAEFYQPGLHEDEVLLQFVQSAQVLMHPLTPPREFAEAVISKSSWTNGQWELAPEDYDNGGFGLTLRKL